MKSEGKEARSSQVEPPFEAYIFFHGPHCGGGAKIGGLETSGRCSANRTLWRWSENF